MATEAAKASSKGEPPDFSTWIDAKEAGKRTGKMERTLLRMAQAGKVTSQIVGGRTLFDPASLPVAEDAPEDITALLNASVNALRESHDTVWKLSERVISMSSATQGTLDALRDQLTNERNHRIALEDELRKGRELLEKVQTEEVQREILRRKAAAEEERTAESYRAFMKVAPAFAMAVADRINPNSRKVDEAFLSMLLERFTDEEIQMLPHVEEHERVVLRDMRKKLVAQKERWEKEQAARVAEEKAKASASVPNASEKKPIDTEGQAA